ncbi:MAG: EthD family reductase [Rhodospirillales bacterium]|nr:EthD family reductase [Rhodospirillales bacterium]
MAKIIFILQRRRDQTHEQCMQYWASPGHTSVVKKIPGLTKWVQNQVVGGPGESACDGVGEIWFASDQAMNQALNSSEMAAAVEDAKNFLDMERTSMIIVQENTVFG